MGRRQHPNIRGRETRGFYQPEPIEHPDLWIRVGFHLRVCDGEAHGNPFIDNCGICMPLWGVVVTRDEPRGAANDRPCIDAAGSFEHDETDGES